MSRSSVALALAIVATVAAPARAEQVTLVAPGGIRAALEALIPLFEKKTGHTVKATFGSGGGTKQQVIDGRPFDVPIVQPPLEPVVQSGHVVAASQTPLASVALAIAVKKGAAKPDISTPEALRRTLLAATAISYPDPSSGAAAGVSFERMMTAMKLTEALRGKLKRASGGAGAMAALAKGDVDLGVTFASEISDPGVDLVGALPRRIAEPTSLVGFVSAHTNVADAAKALLAFLSSPDAAAIYRAHGMEPGRAER